MQHVLFSMVQTLLIIGIAPMVQGIVKKVKALLQRRYGPSIWQPYYDLRKYFQKGEVVSAHASWIFLVTPYVVFAVTVTVAAMIPAFMSQTTLIFTGEVVIMTYLFGLARFFTALSGIDTGSSFGAMGSSRDMFVSALSEPVLLVTLLVIALPLKTTSLSSIATGVSTDHALLFSPAYYLALIAFIILVIAETGRIPVDNPDTHLELTMIHEGILLEYSGKRLGLMMWSAWIKQVVLYALLIDFFLPWGIWIQGNRASLPLSLVFFLIKVLLIGVIVALIESSYAKIRFFRIPRLMFAALALSVIAIAAEYLL